MGFKIRCQARTNYFLYYLSLVSSDWCSRVGAHVISLNTTSQSWSSCCTAPHTSQEPPLACTFFISHLLLSPTNFLHWRLSYRSTNTRSPFSMCVVAFSLEKPSNCARVAITTTFRFCLTGGNGPCPPGPPAQSSRLVETMWSQTSVLFYSRWLLLGKGEQKGTRWA